MGKSEKRQKERSLVYRVWISDRYFTPLLVRNKTKWKMVNLLFKRRNPLWQSIRMKKKKKKKYCSISRFNSVGRTECGIVLTVFYCIDLESWFNIIERSSDLLNDEPVSLSLSLFSLYLKNWESDRIFKPFRYVRVYSASCGPTASLLTTR